MCTFRVREPERAHLRAPTFENTTKSQREDRMGVKEEKKRAKFWAVRRRGGPEWGVEGPNLHTTQHNTTGQGGFRAFPQNQKSATQLPHSNCLCTRAHGRRRLMTRPWCLRKRRRRRRRSARRTLRWSTWVPARQRYCWWLASADGSQVGHAIWRPPWLIGRGPG